MKSNIDGIAVIDGNREFKYLDQSFARLYGYSEASKLIGKPWTETYRTLHVRRFEEEIFPILEEKKWWSGVIFGVNSQGKQFSQKVFVFKLEREELVFLVKNISPTGRSIFEIGQPEINWPEAVVSPPDIVAIISTDYEILEINKTGASRLGKDPKKIEGRQCFEVVHQQSTPVDGCPCKKTLETGEAGIGEVYEDDRHYVVTSFPLSNRSDEISAFLHTVTEVSSSPCEELRACDFFVRGLSQLEDKEGIYRYLINCLNELLGYSKITIYEKEGGRLKCVMQSGYRRPIKGEELVLSGTGVRVESFKENKSYYLPEVKGKGNFIRYDPEVNCEFATPIFRPSKRYGLIDIRRYQPNSISPSDKNLIEVMASEVARKL